MSSYEPRYARIRELVDVDLLHKKGIAFLGCGTVGFNVAIQMATHGVGVNNVFYLLDKDKVSERNLVGSYPFVKYVGLPKVTALANTIRAIDSRISVQCLEEHITPENQENIFRLITRANLVCLFADNYPLMLSISERYYRAVPMVIARIGNMAELAEVCFSIPSETVKICDVFNGAKTNTTEKPKALGFDTSFVTNFMSALCLQILEGKSNPNLPKCDPDYSLYLISLKKQGHFADTRFFPKDQSRSIMAVKTRK